MWVFTSTILLGMGFTLGSTRTDPLVNTHQGDIRGLRVDDGDYSMFLGIPYAQVNESNPFGVSLPQPKFEKIFEAYDDSAVCPQVDEFSHLIVGTLDCLHLNIYVPNNASSTNRLPVLVWIYGGGFTIGYSNRFLYGPKYLVRHDVILVTFNYRVGPYGFMCLDLPEVAGNQGLKDQLLALRWIKNNIASFGGDVDKITLMGESAGAGSVEYHLISNKENLFSQAIMQSFSVLVAGGVVDADVTAPLQIAERLGFQTEDVYEALAFLSNTDTSLVIEATIDLNLQFRVSVEKKFDNVERILTDHPMNLDYSELRIIPILFGFNNQENLLSYAEKNDDFFKNLDVFRAIEIVFDCDEDFQEMENMARHFYIGEEEIRQELWWTLANFDSDFYFNYPIQKGVQKYLDNGATDIYQYLFSYSGERNFVKRRHNITVEGAAHADEIAYLFDISYETTTTAADQLVIDQMTALWTNFVKYGDPTPETTELLPVKWTRMTKDNYNYLDIDAELIMGKRVFHDRMAFWELFFEAYDDKIKAKHEQNDRNHGNSVAPLFLYVFLLGAVYPIIFDILT